MLPILARFGPITIGTHDFFTLLGLVAGFWLYYRHLRRETILDGRIALISVAAVLGFGFNVVFTVRFAAPAEGE